MIEKAIEGLTDALNNLAAAVQGAAAPAGASEGEPNKKPARGTGSATGTAPKKGAGKKKPAAKKGPAATKTDTGDAPTRQQINDLVTKLAALDRKACGEALKKYGKAPRVREVDEDKFPALARGLKAALAKAKEAAADPVDDDFDEDAEDQGAEDDGLDFDEDEPEAEADDNDLDFDDADFD